MPYTARHIFQRAISNETPDGEAILNALEDILHERNKKRYLGTIRRLLDTGVIVRDKSTHRGGWRPGPKYDSFVEYIKGRISSSGGD
jgi:hypothetical protein